MTIREVVEDMVLCCCFGCWHTTTLDRDEAGDLAGLIAKFSSHDNPTINFLRLGKFDELFFIRNVGTRAAVVGSVRWVFHETGTRGRLLLAK